MRKASADRSVAADACLPSGSVVNLLQCAPCKKRTAAAVLTTIINLQDADGMGAVPNGVRKQKPAAKGSKRPPPAKSGSLVAQLHCFGNLYSVTAHKCATAITVHCNHPDNCSCHTCSLQGSSSISAAAQAAQTRCCSRGCGRRAFSLRSLHQHSGGSSEGQAAGVGLRAVWRRAVSSSTAEHGRDYCGACRERASGSGKHAHVGNDRAGAAAHPAEAIQVLLTCCSASLNQALANCNTPQTAQACCRNEVPGFDGSGC